MLALALLCSVCGAAEPAAPPNVVIVFCDDLGYADIGPFGAKDYPTPNLDRMAAEGRRFTSFHVAQAVCSASRTAMLTGCYPNRLGILGALNASANHGIADAEMTLGEVFKQRGYATAAYGKWHLGHHPQFLPPRHGFDEYFGLPYSNDMRPRPAGQQPPRPKAKQPPFQHPPLPLIEGDKTIQLEPDQRLLTTRYAERAVAFIEKNHQRPFFVYLAHTMPHVPLHATDRFAGRPLFQQVIMEIDWSVGQILDALRRHKLDERTWVIFTSDNGPWLSYGNHAGSAAPLREGKGTSFEGGVRVPCVMRWKGVIPAGTTCTEPAMTLDLLPTFAKLVGAKLPDHPIDGLDIMPLVRGDAGAKSPHEAFYFYWGQALEAVRSGPWKLHFPHKYRSLVGEPGRDGGQAGYEQQSIGLALYNLESNVGESTDVAHDHPEVVARLKALAEKARADLGDTATGRVGAGVREPGRLP